MSDELSKVLVSILIPCHNAERWLGQAIESALAQTHAEKEVIVVDDGSTDGSLSVIKSFGERIRWESGPNRGGNVARNRLLELARGEWLQYLDADDYLLPEKVVDQLATAAPNGDVIYSAVIIERWTECGASTREQYPIAEHDPWLLLLTRGIAQTGAALWRRQAIEDVGGWKADQPCGQEVELFLRLLMAGKNFVFSPAIGAVHRIWSEETVGRKNPRQSFAEGLRIVATAEEHLRDTGQLNPSRKSAIALSYFNCARGLFRRDRALSAQAVKRLHRLEPGFPADGVTGIPGSYAFLYRLLGFGATEWLARASRPMRHALRRLVGTPTTPPALALAAKPTDSPVAHAGRI